MKRAVVVSGAGRYADPWHPFAATSDLLGGVLHSEGFAVEVDHDLDRVMAQLGGVDLLVVNAGDPWRGDSADAAVPMGSIEGFAEALTRGIGILAMHTAVATMRDYPEWAGTVGAMWVPGLSMHPPASTSIIRVELGGVVSVDDFDLFDERYCRLQRLGRSDVVAWHDGDGRREPAAWTRTVGRSRIAVDVLGHDERSYESAGHVRLIAQLARWCTADDS